MSSQTFQELVADGVLAIGDGYRAKNSELGGDGPIFLRAAYLQDGGFINDMDDRFRTDLDISFGPKRAQIGDVVITTKGNSTGRLGVIRSEQAGAIYSPHLSYWRSVDQDVLDQWFLTYWAHGREFTNQLKAMAYSTDMAPYLSLRDQLRVEISLPKIEDQRRVASCLQPFDDKTELNRRMNETLEEMARALFRDWFVDFGPTRRQMEGATDPAAIMGQAFPPEKAATLAPLFPAKLGDDGLPEGWVHRPLDEIGHFLNGLALQKLPAQDGKPDLPVIKIAELRNGVSAKSNRASTEVPSKYVIGNGDFIFSWSGSLMAKFWTGGAGALNQHLFKVTSETHPMWFISEWVQTHLEEFQRIAASKAVTMGHIKRSHLAEAMCVCPSDEALEFFGEVFEPLIAKQIANDEENQTLAELRDLLLPKLMSGEIRLKDAEGAA